MSLKGGTSKEGGIGKKIAEGVFLKKGVILSVKQDTEKKLGNYQPDLYVEVEISGKGQYNDTIDLFGNFSREQTGPDEYNGPIKDWGSAGRIDQFFQRMGVSEVIGDDDKDLDTNQTPILIPQSWFEAVKGLNIYYLLHVSGRNPETGKPYYNAFYKAYPVVEGTEEEETEVANQMKNALYSDDYLFGKLQEGRDALDATNDNSQAPTGNVNQPSEGGGLDDDLPI